MGVKDNFLRAMYPAGRKSLTPDGLDLGFGDGSLYTLTRRAGLQALAIEPRTDDEALQKSYRRNQLVRSCVDILANSMADPRLIVQYRNADDEWEEERGHPFRSLLIRPNPKMDGAAFLGFAQKSIEALGIFYAEIVPSRSGLPMELHPVQPLDVRPIFKVRADGSKDLIHYEYRNGQYKKNIPPELMLVRSDLALGGRLSPLASAMRNVDSDNAHADYIRSFFNNAGVPSGLIKIKNREIDEAESDMIRAQYKAKYGRQYGNQHDVMVLDENAEYQRMGAAINELDNTSLRGFDEARICMAFGVPPLIVYAHIGLQQSTYSNLQEAWAQFWDTTMKVKMQQWASWFTVSLLEEFEDRASILAEQARLHWDLSEVTALQDNVTEVADREGKVFQSGVTTVDEMRAAVGKKPHEDPEQGALNYFQLRSASLFAGQPFGAPEPVAESPETADEEEEEETPAEEEEAPEKGTLAALTDGLRRGSVKIINPTLHPEYRYKAQTDEEARLFNQYDREVYALADRARSGEMEKGDFVDALRSLSGNNIMAFFLLGSLLADDEITNAELLALDEHLTAARQSAAELAGDIYGGRYGGVYRDPEEEGQPASLRNRTALWAGAAGAVLVLGRVFRKDDPIQMWRRGRTADPCGDCLAFEGMTLRASLWRELWDRSKLPQGRGLECSGYRCQCDLHEVG